MSDDDEDNFQLYGTLLEPYDEDAIPKKKAFTIEDQIATDDQGRRRFHGAFTGGFSAGYFNTVGSVEGWQPSEFKSSRSEKAEKNIQKPQDFMDDEDMGQFGIAPSVVRATSDYSVKVNRKRNINDGPIPGVPVLESLLQPAKDTVGVKLLKQMGWKPGQGVGPRLTKTEKRKINHENQNSGKVYGCEIPAEFRQNVPDDDGSSSDDELTFAPDDYDPFLVQPKDNSFGMGYSGLDKRPILSSHINLFDPPPAELFKMRDHKNSKISISGQAFGVGAFEQEDEDIYTRDDMSKYDFELESFKKNKKPPKKQSNESLEKMLEGFVLSKNPVSLKKAFPPPILPKNFIPKHGVRLSRFEPLPETHKLFNYDRKKKMGRHDLSSAERMKIINSETIIIKNKEKEVVSVPFNNETPEIEKLTKKAADITKNLPPINTNFKPFVTNPDKQNRYEQYLVLEKIGKDKQLHEIQPASMADWEKERERYEFAQASRMFKPVAGLVFDKFVVASTPEDPFKPVEKTIYLHGSKDMRDAAQKKMFGPLTRTIELWVPHKLLCRRFNVPDPDITETEMSLSKKKKGKYNVFDYYEAYQQNKEGPKMPEKNEVPEITENETTSTITEEIVTETVLEEPKKVETLLSEEPKKVVETFKTSKTIFLEESSHNIASTSTVNTYEKPDPVIPKPVIPIDPSTRTNTYKKPDPLIPKPVIPTDPKEKKDLFQAIFLSSSESENEDQDNQEDIKMDEMKKIILEENHAPQFDQPIVNASKGIFSNLDWSKVNRNPINKETTTLRDVTPPKVIEKIDIYGPKLPTTPCLTKNSEVVVVVEKKLKDSSSSSEDDWMEANASEKSSKTSKKHKKHKSKHKKHKSKHKKKKSKH